MLLMQLTPTFAECKLNLQFRPMFKRPFPKSNRTSWAALATDPLQTVCPSLCTTFTAADHRHTLKTLSQRAVQPHSDLVCVQLRPPTTSSQDSLPSSENVLSPIRRSTRMDRPSNSIWPYLSS